MKKLKFALKIFILISVAATIVIFSINLYIVLSANNKITDRDSTAEMYGIDYVVVLGCGINGNRPTHMLEDRLLEGMAVAESIPDCKLILTGDNSGKYYNEVGVMKSFCLEKGFDENRIITDDFGFSTGESLENTKNVFGGNNVIIITQKYHTYRALFIAEIIGLDAHAVPSDPRSYSTWLYKSVREPLARVKDFIKYIIVK
ncbi:MAG: YdcF family protein [Clostridia bacterium]|nr:YdcF family protein [Clostridia bacterium]